MKLYGYLTFNGKRLMRLTKGAPKLRQGEYAVKLCVDIPAGIVKPVTPSVTITVPEQAVIEPKVTVEGAPDA